MRTSSSSGILSIVVASALAGCTAMHIEALPRTALDEPRVCIERNPAVRVSDFLDVVQRGFQRHGIATEVYEGARPPHCEAFVTYTARQSWDLATYLSVAEIEMYRGGQRIAYAKYWLRGKGGYALTKYEGTEKKMRPVMDKLLADYRGTVPSEGSGT